MYEYDGRLALDVPAGTHRFSVRYRPKSLGIGLATSLLGVVVTALYLLFLRRQARRAGAA